MNDNYDVMVILNEILVFFDSIFVGIVQGHVMMNLYLNEVDQFVLDQYDCVPVKKKKFF